MKVIYYILSSLFILAGGAFGYLYFQEQASAREQAKLAKEKLNIVERAWNGTLLYSGNLYCAMDAGLISIDNEHTSLGKLIGNKTDKLVLRIAQNFCTKCLDTELPRLQQFSHIIGEENILLITNRSNLAEIGQMLQMKSIGLPVYGIDEKEKVFKNMDDQAMFGFPYFFMADSSGIATSFFVTSSSDHQLSIHYFSALKEKLQQSNSSSGNNPGTGKAGIRFSSDSHNFGKISYNKPVEYTFSFENTGSQPLYILSVDAGCDCTTASYSLEEIRPHKNGHITVRYDASYKGDFKRKLQIFSNAANSPASLYIEGTVE